MHNGVSDIYKLN